MNYIYQDSGYGAVNGTTFGVYFFGGIFPSKIDPKDFYLATIQALSKARAFLLRVKISKGCFVSDTPPAISRPYLILP
jgi:hypothetical protein